MSDNPGIGGGIYLLLGRNYVRHRLTHSWLAIIYFQQACQFLATKNLTHKCSKGSSKGPPNSLSLSCAYCGVYLNQIKFTGKLNFRRRHWKVGMSINTKERGSQKRIRRPLRGDFRQCEYIEKLWRENQTSHEGF